MQEFLHPQAKKLVGYKQTKRAIQQDVVKEVYLASDVDEFMQREIEDLCQNNMVTLKTANMTQQELGRACQIEVAASMVAILKE